MCLLSSTTSFAAGVGALQGQRDRSCTSRERGFPVNRCVSSVVAGSGRSLSLAGYYFKSPPCQRGTGTGHWRTCAGSHQIDTFVDWFKASGGQLRDDVAVCEDGCGQLSLHLSVGDAGGSKQVRDHFVALPRGLRVDAAAADAAPVGGLWRWTDPAARASGLVWAPDDMADILGECLLQNADPMGPFRREAMRVALFLLAEEANPSSPWGPYLALFPTMDELSDHGIFWTEEQLIGFGDMGLVEVALRHQSAVRSMYDFFVKPGFTPCTGLPLPSLEQFNRAVAIAEARVLYDSSASLEALCGSDPGGPASAGAGGACALLPMIELAGLVDTADITLNCAISTETGSTFLTPLSSQKSGRSSSSKLICQRWRGGVVPAYISLVHHGMLPALSSSSTIASHLLFPETPFGGRMAEEMRKEVGSAFPWWRPFPASIEAVERECVSLAREYLSLDSSAGDEKLFMKYKLGKALAIAYAGLARYEAKKGGGNLPEKVLARGKAGYVSTDRATQLFWRSVLDHRRAETTRRERGEEATSAILDV